MSDLGIFKVIGPDRRGVPYLGSTYDPDDLNDPQAMKALLDVERIAKAQLPFVDSRTRYWRYYLLAVPMQRQRGAAALIGQKLLCVLRNNDGNKGVGRRIFNSNKDMQAIYASYESGYKNAAKDFWDNCDSNALKKRAKDFRVKKSFDGFFNAYEPDGWLKRLFHQELIRRDSALAKYVKYHKYNIFEAAKASSASEKLNDDHKKLFFSWALLQAYYAIAGNDEDDEPAEDGEWLVNGNYLQELAKFCISCIKEKPSWLPLPEAQAAYIQQALDRSVKNKTYHPPVKVSAQKADGSARRVFASLRLSAYARLLQDTDPEWPTQK